MKFKMHDPLPNSTAVLSFLNLLYTKESLVCYKNNFLKIMQLISKNSLILFISLTNNNIICTLTDLNGRVLKSISIGSKKTRGVKKVTNATVFTITKILYKYIVFNRFPSLYLRIKGTHKLKNEFIKSLKIQGLIILMIQEKLFLPHGGCKSSRTRKL